MSTRRKWTAVIVVGFVIAVLFGANGPLGGFWGGDTSDEDIPGGALAGLVMANLVESLAFGAGLAWFAFGWQHVQHAGRRLATATYVAIGWGIVSWFPHSSLHIAWEEDDWYALAAIEWGFHVTLVVAAVIVATYVWRTLTDPAPRPSARAMAA